MVSIPIKLYTAASAGGVSFNILHAKCGNRIKQQTFCPVCNEVVERGKIARLAVSLDDGVVYTAPAAFAA